MSAVSINKKEKLTPHFIIEVRGSRVWVHFAVRPKNNRRKILFDVK